MVKINASMDTDIYVYCNHSLTSGAVTVLIITVNLSEAEALFMRNSGLEKKNV